jgi:predicted DsbA family dithiol-disulfide isomerase
VIATVLALGLAVPSPAPPEEVVARVGARAITAAELQAAAGPRLIEVQTKEHALQRAALDDLVERELLRQEAARREVTVEALLAAEVDARIPPIGEWDLAAHRKAHPADYEGRSEAEALEQAARRVREERLAQRRFGFLAGLRARTPPAISLPPPRIKVDDAGSASRGPADAPVTIVEFSEFQCPFCRRVLPTLHEVEERYRGKVRLVFRHFPLARHKEAPLAAEAAECARDQGRFWEMHDRLFANADQLGAGDLKKHARAVGVDGVAFDACLDSRRHEARWRRDLADAQSYGASGTPMFFVNGRLVSGAQPLAAFAKVIEEELKVKAGGGDGSLP